MIRPETAESDARRLDGVEDELMAEGRKLLGAAFAGIEARDRRRKALAAALAENDGQPLP